VSRDQQPWLLARAPRGRHLPWTHIPTPPWPQKAPQLPKDCLEHAVAALTSALDSCRNPPQTQPPRTSLPPPPCFSPEVLGNPSANALVARCRLLGPKSVVTVTACCRPIRAFSVTPSYQPSADTLTLDSFTKLHWRWVHVKGPTNA